MATKFDIEYRDTESGKLLAAVRNVNGSFVVAMRVDKGGGEVSVRMENIHIGAMGHPAVSMLTAAIAEERARDVFEATREKLGMALGEALRIAADMKSVARGARTQVTHNGPASASDPEVLSL